MFRKILDKARNINLQKIKRDAEIGIKRTAFNAKEMKNEIKNGWDKTNFTKNLPGYKNYYNSLKKNMKLDTLDKIYTQKVDKVSQKASENLSGALKSLKKAGGGLKSLPKLFGSTLFQFGRETKEFFSDGYTMSKSHINNYFRKNKKYFDQRKASAFGYFTKSKRRIYMFAGSAIFLYGLGSNLPDAILRYRLAKEMQTKKE